MAKYKLSNEAKEDLIKIYKYGVKKFGVTQADKYFNIIADRLFSFKAVDYIKNGYRRCPSRADSIYYKLNSKNIVEIMALVGR